MVLSTAAEENSSVLPDGLMLQLSLINPISESERGGCSYTRKRRLESGGGGENWAETI